MRALASSLLVLCMLATALVPTGDARADAKTIVLVNGKPMPVFFNDGDSFRVLAGALAGTKARLAGYNTLESYGPVHSWGDASPKEMYVIAKMATLLGRRGVWSCTSDMTTDTYGRALLHCPELSEEMIRKGFAHAMTVTADPAAEPLLVAQREAIAAGRGIWSQGTPEWVLTSLHSVEERPDKPTAYNRLVSSIDGHSEKWRHTRHYKECDKECIHDAIIEPAVMDRSVEALKGSHTIGEHFGGLSAAQQVHVVRFFAMAKSVVALVPRGQREAYRSALESLVAQGHLVFEQGPSQSCMVYVDFKRRFGGDKAKCLK